MAKTNITMQHIQGSNRSIENLKTKLTIATILSALFTPNLYAHTSSVGYENAGAGAVTFWYGTYHGNTSFTEGSLEVAGPSNYLSTVPFTLLVTNKPAGLIDGVTNFYSNGSTLVGTPQSGHIAQSWQGATFSNLSPGTYTFTYIPIQNPTQEWEPVNFVILSNSVILDASILGGGLFTPNSTQNSSGAAAVLDSLVGNANTTMSNTLADLVLLSKEQQTAALNRIAPNTSQASGFAATQTVTGNLDTVQMRLDALRTDSFQTSAVEDLKAGKIKLAANGDLSTLFNNDIKKYGFWTKVFGGRGNQDMRSGFAGYDMSTTGMAFGGDTLLENNWVVGTAFTYAKTNVNMTNFRDGDHSDIKTYQLTAYAAKDFGKWYLESMLAYARQNYDSSRNTTISGIAKSDYDSDQVAGRINVGYPLAIGERSKITPIVGMEWINLQQNGYTEKGAGPLSMKFKDESADRIRSLLAVKFSSEYELSNGMRLVPSVQVGWRHDFKNDGLNTTTNFIGGGSAFKTEGQEIARNTYSLGGALRLQKSDNFSLSLQLDGERTTGYSAVTGQFVAHWKF
ncbi:autotransporter outer membrane beta-barrel domain-containing protein [Methylobacillus gramineus]|uniref:autotransporter family protein n=1 Tax=Methylobacillus gramineus TaxID=755169 RepID=UPI001CFFC628|nr:autotransporter outer membrane beta-barrel domain-containing protein [Methylobacillus gramineus]MCB5185900.1 autotransporter outer membrane beta-barrel domain-containing protein [Methylobacillus gramineus]